MYSSPITLMEDIVRQKTTEVENGIVTEIQIRYGVDVNKEELVKALQYDRNQYEAGYRDGTKALDKIRAEIEALPKTYPFINHWVYTDDYVKEDDVLEIIDKYRMEQT